MLAVHEIEQRHRLAAQCVDDVTIVDYVSTSLAIDAGSAPQALHRCAAKKAFQPIIIQTEPQAMAD